MVCVFHVFFLGFSLFVVVISETIGLTGENVCEETEHFIITVQKVYKKPVQIREYKWCMQIPPRCEETRTIFKDEHRIEEQPHSRIVKKCCEGFREDHKTNTCTRSECQYCKHASCSNEGQCICYAGYKGKYCDSVCPKGTWGFQCSFSCECENNATCSPSDGRCLCTTGWIGLKCNIPCPYGFYGDNCSKFCQCLPRLTCHPQTGECLNQEVPGKYTTTEASTVTTKTSYTTNPFTKPTEPSLVKLRILPTDEVTEKQTILPSATETKKMYILTNENRIEDIKKTSSTLKEDKSISGEDKIKHTTVSMKDMIKPILPESTTPTVSIPSITPFMSTFSSTEDLSVLNKSTSVELNISTFLSSSTLTSSSISETTRSSPSTLLTSQTVESSSVPSQSLSSTTALNFIESLNSTISKSSPSTTSLFDSTEAIDFDNFFNVKEEENDEILNFSKEESFEDPTVEPTNFLVEETSTKRINIVRNEPKKNLSHIFAVNDLNKTPVIDEDDVTKDLEHNNDLIRRVHHAILEEKITTNIPDQPKYPFVSHNEIKEKAEDEEDVDNMRIKEQDLPLIHENYHGMIIAVCGISLGIILAVILAALILHITDSKPRNTLFYAAPMKETGQQRVQYLATNNYQEQVPETASVLNPIFSSNVETKLKGHNEINTNHKIDDFITDTLRVAFDNTYDHPRTIKLQTSTFSTTTPSFLEVEPFYDEIPAWNDHRIQVNELKSFSPNENPENSYINTGTLKDSSFSNETGATRL